MVKDVLHSIAAAARRLFANWAALLISFSMYSALLGAIYYFFTIREATATQVALNLILPIAAVALFFMASVVVIITASVKEWIAVISGRKQAVSSEVPFQARVVPAYGGDD